MPPHTVTVAQTTLGQLDQALAAALNTRARHLGNIASRGNKTALLMDFAEALRANADVEVYDLVAAIIDRIAGGDFPSSDEEIVATIHRHAAKVLTEHVALHPGIASAADSYIRSAWIDVYHTTETRD